MDGLMIYPAILGIQGKEIMKIFGRHTVHRNYTEKNAAECTLNNDVIG